MSRRTGNDPMEMSLTFSDSDEDEEGQSDHPTTVGSDVGKKRKRREKSPTRGRKKTKKSDARGARSRHWFLTFNNADDDDIETVLGLGAVSYVMQEETSSTGTPHLQGVFSFRNPKYWRALNNKTGGQAYWAPALNIPACRNYCRKERTRTGRRWNKGYTFQRSQKILHGLEGKTLYHWQQKLMDILMGDPDKRKIYWIWSDGGGKGKSTFCKYLVMKEDATYTGGTASDAFYAVKQRIEEGKSVDIVLFDIPRSRGNNIDHEAMECIKNGLFFSGKYKGGQTTMNIPHMFVFANQSPQRHMMSDDRWIIVNLDNETDC